MNIKTKITKKQLKKTSVIANHTLIKNVYRLLEAAKIPVTITYLAEAVRYPKNTVHRVILLLIYLDLVEKTFVLNQQIKLYRVKQKEDVIPIF